MAEVDAFIWYDPEGNIIGCGIPHPAIARRVEPIAADDRVLRIKLSEDTAATLHETHYVDVSRRELTRRGNQAQ